MKKRKLYGRVEVGAHKIPIYWIPLKEAKQRMIYGQSNLGPGDLFIELAETLAGERLQNVLWHELIHVCAELGGVRLSEQSVNALAENLRQAMKTLKVTRREKPRKS